MSKPRDISGNDFIAPCAFLAEMLFRDKYKRDSNPKAVNDSKKIRVLASDLYSVCMRHWKEWGNI